MSSFGDDEPEDAWHPDDPLAELLANLAKRLLLVYAARTYGDRERRRLEGVIEDLEHVRSRVP